MTRAPEEPFLVTSAGKSPREEQRERTRRYLVTMAIRTACIVMAVVFYVLDLHVLAAVTAAASLILPWVAVVAANAGPRREVLGRPALYEREPAKQIGDGRD